MPSHISSGHNIERSLGLPTSKPTPAAASFDGSWTEAKRLLALQQETEKIASANGAVASGSALRAAGGDVDVSKSEGSSPTAGELLATALGLQPSEAGDNESEVWINGQRTDADRNGFAATWEHKALEDLTSQERAHYDRLIAPKPQRPDLSVYDAARDEAVMRRFMEADGVTNIAPEEYYTRVRSGAARAASDAAHAAYFNGESGRIDPFRPDLAGEA